MDNLKTAAFFFENDYFIFDATNFPRLYLNFKIEEPNRQQFDEYLECWNKIIATQKPYSLLSDYQNTEYMKAEFRVELGEWINKHTEYINEFCKGAANIVLDEEQQLLLQHMIKMHKPVYPFFITDNKEKAKEWLEGRV